MHINKDNLQAKTLGRCKPPAFFAVRLKKITQLQSILPLPHQCLYRFIMGMPIALALPLLATPAFAYDVNEQISVSGVLAGAGQYQNLSDVPGFKNGCEAALPFQLEIHHRHGDHHEVFFKFGFANGNGINAKSPFSLSPWAADLENDLKDINGRNRDNLLTAWYKHSFALGNEQQLGATLGIIDATDYLDENAYANDEFTQFMNSALVNGPILSLPSYDFGAAAEWDQGAWSLRGVIMDIGQNDDGHRYQFYAVQLAYSADHTLGPGTYRLVLTRHSDAFLNPAGSNKENLSAALISLDQALGDNLAGWLRIGTQADDAAVDHDTLYAAGIDIHGSTWGRVNDNIGIGVAQLDGGNGNIDRTQLIETYYRMQCNEMLGLTADVQYQKDDYRVSQGPDGWIISLRAVAEF